MSYKRDERHVPPRTCTHGAGKAAIAFVIARRGPRAVTVSQDPPADIRDRMEEKKRERDRARARPGLCILGGQLPRACELEALDYGGLSCAVLRREAKREKSTGHREEMRRR